MEIFPDAISFKGSETGDLSISFDDNVGVKLSSPSKLSLNASEEIIIKTPETIEMNASNNIFLAKTNTRSGISIENEFHFLSDNVIQDGQDRETFSKYDDEPKEAEKPEKGFNWCALAIFAVAAVVAVAAIVLTGGILAAAIVGACVAVACTAVGDMITGEMSSFKDYFLSALSGAICGAIFGCLNITSLLGLMGVGALEGGLDSLIRQLGNGEFNLRTLLIDMGLGALFGGIFYNLGKVVRRIAPRAKNALQNAIRKAMPRIKSGLTRAKEGAAIRVNALIRALRNNDVPITRGLGSNFGNLNPDYVRNLKKLYNEAKNDIAEGINKAYTGGRTQADLEDLARDPSHAGRIEEQGIKEREVGLALEERGDLGNIVRDMQTDKGAEFIDTTTGLKWDVKSFESYPVGSNGIPITKVKNGAFRVDKGMAKIYGEFDKGNNVIIDTRKLIPEHIEQLKKAIDEAGIEDRIIWYP